MTVGSIGIALAGGGPLGAIYEIGALVALDEALSGVDLAECDIYVGVSSGSFIAAGLANGLTPRDMYRMFIETEAADDPFEPDVLMRRPSPSMAKSSPLCPDYSCRRPETIWRRLSHTASSNRSSAWRGPCRPESSTTAVSETI